MTPTSTLQLACPTCGDEATGGRLPDRPHCLIPVAAGAREAPTAWGAVTRPVSAELPTARNYRGRWQAELATERAGERG